MKNASQACPICRKQVESGAELFPFCSRGCKLVDLGRWLDGTYRVPEHVLAAGASNAWTPRTAEDRHAAMVDGGRSESNAAHGSGVGE